MTEIEAHREMTRSDVAEYLRDFAAQLDTAEYGTTDSEYQAGSDRFETEQSRQTADSTDTSTPVGTSEADAGSPSGFEQSSDAGTSSSDEVDGDHAAGGDRRVTFMVGDDSATINPPETVEFEISVESDSSFVSDEVDHEVEFQLSWKSQRADEDRTEQDLEVK